MITISFQRRLLDRPRQQPVKLSSMAFAMAVLGAVEAEAASKSSASIIRKNFTTPAACHCPWNGTLTANCAAFRAAPCRLTLAVAVEAAAEAVNRTTVTKASAGTLGSPSNSTWRSVPSRWSTFLGFAPCPSWHRLFRKRYILYTLH